MQMTTSRSKIPLRVLLWVAITGALFVFVEGLGSTAIFVYEILMSPVVQRTGIYYAAHEDHRFARYDEALGWVSIPNVYIPDMYGPGRYVRTNARAFRNDDEIAAAIPYGKARVICSGDSFTFGQGVANSDTWCERLRQHNAQLETVNMGQRGYGVDQAFLWYMRDGALLDHTIHLFAFIDGDFGRMRSSSHHGYGKPVLRMEGGQIVSDNVPVSRRRYYRPWMSHLGRAAGELRSLQFIQRSRRKLLGPESPSGHASLEETRAVALEIFQELRRKNAEKNSVLVLVRLPVRSDIYQESSRWETWVKTVADTSNLLFVDLAPALRALRSATAETFFIPEGSPDYIDGDLHYNERGHEWIAQTLYDRLSELPAVAAALQRAFTSRAASTAATHR